MTSAPGESPSPEHMCHDSKPTGFGKHKAVWNRDSGMAQSVTMFYFVPNYTKSRSKMENAAFSRTQGVNNVCIVALLEYILMKNLYCCFWLRLPFADKQQPFAEYFIMHGRCFLIKTRKLDLLILIVEPVTALRGRMVVMKLAEQFCKSLKSIVFKLKN